MKDVRSNTKSEMDFLRKVCPTATADVTIDATNRCLYRFTLTVTRACRDIAGTFYFKLAEGFAALTDIDPPSAAGMVMFDPDTGEGEWTFDTAEGNPARLQFSSVYTGEAGVDIFDDSEEENNRVEYTLTWHGCTLTGTVDVDVPEDETAEDCPITPPVDVEDCCEACDDDYEEFNFESCDVSYVAKPVDVVVVPTGRRLSVHLNMPSVCQSKDVLVGVFVNEVMNYGDPVNEMEVPFAHKVIRRTATDLTTPSKCKDDRDCDCVDFMIDDDDITTDVTGSACNARYFRVRTQAHYADAINEQQQCPCNCPRD